MAQPAPAVWEDPAVRFHADLHIHSKYSRACSKDCDLEHLTWWARRKGIALVGTGDFTHPAWFEHLQQNLVPAEPGLFRLRDDLDQDIVRRLPAVLAATPVRFLLSVEISTIYKRGERTRKVHHLVYMPSFDAAAEFNRRLGRIGNLGSDGRPILGLDSRDLLEITLGCGDGAYLVPAHVWTPWFAVLGSKSGFDAIEDCYLDLSDHIFALETGLSSDPAMNWRISGLDRYRMVSNSDAHSPPMLGRETTLFDTDLDYFAVKRALETGQGHVGSVEFFPEEGKYHVDGHRKCGVRLEPQQTREYGGHCPECGKPLTVGVLNRVEELADRPEPVRPAGAPDFLSFVPLPEIMSEILGVGPKSKRVAREIDRLTSDWGSELAILETVPPDELRPRTPLLAEAVTRLRRGDVIREAGYDGEYGVIRLFQPDELKRATAVTVPALFDDAPFTAGTTADRQPAAPAERSALTPHSGPSLATPSAPVPVPQQRSSGEQLHTAPDQSDRPGVTGPEIGPAPADSSLLAGLDPEQRAAAGTTGGPLLIIAGPGTGKTRTLTHRIAHLVTEHDVAPERCLAITFTRRAAQEMAERLTALVPDHAPRLTIATFHSLGRTILREQYERAGLSAEFGIADEARQLQVATEVTGAERPARRLLAEAARQRRGTGDPEHADAVRRYTEELRRQDLVDFDELITLPARLLEAEPDLAAGYRDRYRWVSVDEYQDIDEQQYRLLRLLTPPDGNLTAIGDPDQSIYRFRGADVGFFLRFEQDFPSARRVQLTRNYRSGAGILTAALQVVSPTTLVPDRALTPVGAHGDTPVQEHTAADERAEASWVARTIEQLLGGASFHSLDSGRVETDGDGGLGFSDFAVLYRTDRASRAVADALTVAGLPFQKRSHQALVDRPGVRLILRELDWATDRVAAPDEPVTRRVRRAAEAVLGRLPQAAKAVGTAPEDAAVRESGDDAVTPADIHAAVSLLDPPAERCGTDLARFRDELALGVEVDTWDPRADRISLLTLHAAKGLEFPVVFVVGCEDGLLPLRLPGAHSQDDEEQLREERRLLFVGMTRAQRLLYLTHAQRRARHGGIAPTGRSPFLSALDGTASRRTSVPRARSAPRDTQLRLL